VQRGLCLSHFRPAIRSLTLGIVSLAFNSSARAQGITFIRLNPATVVIRDSAYSSNMTVIRTAAGLMVIDNFMHRTSTRQALAMAADSLGSSRIALVVNTHGHDDHTWGNQVLTAGSPPPPIVAHAATTAYMQARIGQMQEFFRRGPGVARASEDSLAAGSALPDSVRSRLRGRAERVRQNLAAHGDLVVTPPTASVSRDTMIVVGSTQVFIRSAGAAHSAGDLSVVVPAAGVMAVGDLALVDELPGLDGTSGSVAGWIAALGALGAESQRVPVRWIVPGHGPLGDASTLRASLNYLTALRDSVGSARAEGLTLEATQRRLQLPAFVTRPTQMERHLRNVEAAWRLWRPRERD
jgi:cyclase